MQPQASGRTEYTASTGHAVHAVQVRTGTYSTSTVTSSPKSIGSIRSKSTQSYRAKTVVYFFRTFFIRIY